MSEKRIIFVCTGNVCRSPMAEYMLKARLEESSPWQIASAGLAAGVGMPASRPAIRVLAEEGIDLTVHRSQPLQRSLVNASSVIVGMTDAHRRQIVYNFQEAAGRVFLLGSFGSRTRDVPDPIGLSDDAYYRIRDIIEDALPELMSFLDTLHVK